MSGLWPSEAVRAFAVPVWSAMRAAPCLDTQPIAMPSILLTGPHANGIHQHMADKRLGCRTKQKDRTRQYSWQRRRGIGASQPARSFVQLFNLPQEENNAALATPGSGGKQSGASGPLQGWLLFTPCGSTDHSAPRPTAKMISCASSRLPRITMRLMGRRGGPSLPSSGHTVHGSSRGRRQRRWRIEESEQPKH